MSRAGLRVNKNRMAQDDSGREFSGLPVFTVNSCPLLPPIDHLPALSAAGAGPARKDARFYRESLELAQRRWCEGKPAQAILQLNKAFMADLSGDEEILATWPPPYGVLVWILRHRLSGAFLGNPVRHFQHLATRVSGERKEIRSWRAWACFHLARATLPGGEFPVDAEQVEKEQLVFPDWGEVLGRIEASGWAGESEWLAAVASGLHPGMTVNRSGWGPHP